MTSNYIVAFPLHLIVTWQWEKPRFSRFILGSIQVSPINTDTSEECRLLKKLVAGRIKSRKKALCDIMSIEKSDL